jgi:ankyrin repeat protein
VSDEPLLKLARAIGAGDTAEALRQLAASPELAKTAFADGATRQAPKGYYKGDTALHIAAAGYRTEIVRALVAAGADVRARNRRGIEPLHYASVGQPGSPSWNPGAQAETIACLIQAGAEPNAGNNDEVTALHRAVRTRCAAAVKALLDGGASLSVRNKHGSTPPMLATRTTGRGGSGSAAAKAELEEIVRLLERRC